MFVLEGSAAPNAIDAAAVEDCFKKFLRGFEHSFFI